MSYRKLALAAGMIVSLAAAPAFAGPAKAVSVDSSNIDLGTEAGFAKLMTKVDVAAKKACDYKHSGQSLRKERQFERCYSDVIEATAESLGLEQDQQAQLKDGLLG